MITGMGMGLTGAYPMASRTKSRLLGWQIGKKNYYDDALITK